MHRVQNRTRGSKSIAHPYNVLSWSGREKSAICPLFLISRDEIGPKVPNPPHCMLEVARLPPRGARSVQDHRGRCAQHPGWGCYGGPGHGIRFYTCCTPAAGLLRANPIRTPCQKVPKSQISIQIYTSLLDGSPVTPGRLRVVIKVLNSGKYKPI